VPAAKPDSDWLPLVAVLLTPLPLSDTEVALALVHAMVAVPGAAVVVGVAVIDAVTAAGAAMVTVCEIVAEAAPAESIAFAVNVMLAGPASDVGLPESLSVPLPPPANANPLPLFQTFTWTKFPSASWPWAEMV